MAKRLNIAIIFLLLLGALIGGCSSQPGKSTLDKGQKEVPVSTSPPAQPEKIQPADGKLNVHFIDVGQGDCILVQSPQNQYLLIDGGQKDQGKKVCSYLTSLGVKRLDVVLGTHPHSDHIGGLIEVIKEFPVNKIYLPEVIHTSPAFEELLQAIKSKQLKINTAKAGVRLPLEGIEARLLAPLQDRYEDLNNYSAVLKLVYGKTSFLFTGDAEKESEKQMLESGEDVKADVLKVGHHGSSNASSADFLKAVSPRYAVIMCGLANDYGHPHKETIEALQKTGIEIFRVDKDGTILASSDGQRLEFSKNKGTGSSNAAPPGVVQQPSPSVPSNSSSLYIGNKNSKKFHLSTCQSLPAKKNRIEFSSRAEALAQGYVPCQSCNP